MKKDDPKFFEKIIEEINNFFIEYDISTVNQNITIRYLKSLRRSKVRNTTIRNNVDIMKFLLKNIKTDLDKLIRSDVIDYCDALTDWQKRGTGKPISLATDKAYRVGFHRFLTRYTEDFSEEEIEHRTKIAKELKTSNKVETQSRSFNTILTKKEVDRLIDAAGNERNAALVSVMYDSGSRVGEIISCRIGDIEFNNEGYKITLNGKTGIRSVQCVESAQNLSSWLDHHPLKNDVKAPLFTTTKLVRSNDEEPAHISLAEHGVAAVIQKATKRAGITKHTYPHLLRHSRATHLAAKGLNEPILRKIFGWSRSSTTPSLYIHLSGVNTDDAILKIHGLSNKKDDQIFEMDRCPRCKTVIRKDDPRCKKCNFALTKEAEQVDYVLNQALRSYYSQHQEDQPQLMNLMLSSQK